MEISLSQTEITEIIKNYLLTEYGLRIIDVISYKPFAAVTKEIQIKEIK
jgi:hypothetical protein